MTRNDGMGSIMWAFVFCLAVGFSHHLNGINTSQYVGRIVPTWRKGLSVGDWLGYSNGPKGFAQENKATFGVPGSVIDVFFNNYEYNNASDCRAAYTSIGFAQSDIDSLATAYSNGDQFFTYVLLPSESVNATPALWENVISLALSLYAPWTNSTFNLSQVLHTHLPQFQNWSSEFRANNDPFPYLYASDLKNTSFLDLTSPPNPNFITSHAFFALENPSAVATRAWLRVKFGLFPEFMGDGFTLPANKSAQGLAEVIFENRQIEGSDIMIQLSCAGNGFLGSPGYMSAIVRAYDSFEVYADGEFIAQSTPGIINDNELVNLNATTNLIGIRGRAAHPDPGNGILVTVGGRTVSNASWYCQKGFNISWTKFGFDFTGFPRAVTRPQGDGTDTDLLHQNPSALYIWTANNSDTEVYCTIALGSYSPLTPPPSVAPPAISAASSFTMFPLILSGVAWIWG